MSDRSGSNSGLAFIVGALVVAVIVLGYFFFAGSPTTETADITIEMPEVEAPEAPEAPATE